MKIVFVNNLSFGNHILLSLFKLNWIENIHSFSVFNAVYEAEGGNVGIYHMPMKYFVRNAFENGNFDSVECKESISFELRIVVALTTILELYLEL